MNKSVNIDLFSIQSCKSPSTSVEQISSPVDSNGRVFTKNMMCKAFECTNCMTSAISNLLSNNQKKSNQLVSPISKSTFEQSLKENLPCLTPFNRFGYFDGESLILTNESTNLKAFEQACEENLGFAVDVINGEIKISGSSTLYSELEKRKANSQTIIIQNRNKISVISYYSFNLLSEYELIFMNKALKIHLLYLHSIENEKKRKVEEEERKAQEQSLTSAPVNRTSIYTEKTPKKKLFLIDIIDFLISNKKREHAISEMKFLILLLIERIMISRREDAENKKIEIKIEDIKHEILKSYKKNQIDKDQQVADYVKLACIIVSLSKLMKVEYSPSDIILKASPRLEQELNK